MTRAKSEDEPIDIRALPLEALVVLTAQIVQATPLIGPSGQVNSVNNPASMRSLKDQRSETQIPEGNRGGGHARPRGGNRRG